MKGKRFGAKRGFTLVEIMVVVLIIGLIAGIVVKTVSGHRERALRTTAKAQIREIMDALELFYNYNLFYPSTEQTLQALAARPTTGRNAPDWQECMPSIPTDPWGNEYVYFCPGTGGRPFEVICYGADGAPGGDGVNADLVSWDLSD